MASWNDLEEGSQLVKCPVCMAKVAKKRKTVHVNKCCETYAEHMKEEGLIKCPLYPQHILPKRYLNHHLEGNCEEAMNQLRKYFQHHKLHSNDPHVLPRDFLSDVPDSILNNNNKLLLFILRRDLDGNDLNYDKSLYPDAPCIED